MTAGPSRGSCCRWVDQDVQAGRPYSYKLELIGTGDRTAVYGPVQVVVPYALYLPMVMQRQDGGSRYQTTHESRQDEKQVLAALIFG